MRLSHFMSPWQELMNILMTVIRILLSRATESVQYLTLWDLAFSTRNNTGILAPRSQHASKTRYVLCLQENCTLMMLYPNYSFSSLPPPFSHLDSAFISNTKCISTLNLWIHSQNDEYASFCSLLCGSWLCTSSVRSPRASTQIRCLHFPAVIYKCQLPFLQAIQVLSCMRSSNEFSNYDILVHLCNCSGANGHQMVGLNEYVFVYLFT